MADNFPFIGLRTVKFNIEFCEKRHFTSYEQGLSLEQVARLCVKHFHRMCGKNLEQRTMHN